MSQEEQQRGSKRRRPRTLNEHSDDELEEWVAMDDGTFRRAHGGDLDIPALKRVHLEREIENITLSVESPVTASNSMASPVPMAAEHTDDGHRAQAQAGPAREPNRQAQQ